MKLTLIGIDPGIRDTACVVIKLNTQTKKWRVQGYVWHDVTSRNGRSIDIDQKFLDQLEMTALRETRLNGATFVGIEGYRQRGKDQAQDQNMITLVQEIQHRIKGSTIVDNTGIKKIVSNDLLKLFQAYHFGVKTNHGDLTSAARVALALGIKTDALNEILSEFVDDNIYGEAWSLESIPTL